MSEGASREDEWLWGWDETPGIVSVWGDWDGRATVWRRVGGALVREEERFRPWVVLSSTEDLRHLGPRLGDARKTVRGFDVEKLSGAHPLAHLVSATDGRALVGAILRGASARLGREVTSLRELGQERIVALSPEEQYLARSGRTSFRGLGYDDVRRMQIDLETTGLDPDRDRIFMVALRTPDGDASTLRATGDDAAGEADLLLRLCAEIRSRDPDVVENHNLHGFDLPFLVRRAKVLGVPLALGREGPPGLTTRAAMRGARFASDADRANDALRRVRFSARGREMLDSMDAVRRHDFSARDLPGHGLKALARHFGFAREHREYVPGSRIHAVYLADPERVARYAEDDVHEAASLSRLLGGAAFALAQMCPRRYERLADAGAATGIVDPLLVRAYLREGRALPTHEPSDGTPHQGAALRIFATGVAERIVKADVASLYPSLMIEYRIGPARDDLGAMLSLVERLVAVRLDAKAAAKRAAAGSSERFGHEAIAAAMKLVVNSAYGYLGASSLTRFADVHAANEVTRRGREALGIICRGLEERNVTLLEADTDGVYFATKEGTLEEDEARIVAEVGALLPKRVRLELEGRYRAMLSHEPKNYALLHHDGKLVRKGVAFRSSRSEPFGESFLDAALERLLRGDLAGVRAAYVSTVSDLRALRIPTAATTTRVRITKSSEEYASTRAVRRELGYEALLGAGRTRWRSGEKIRVYRATGQRAALFDDERDDAEPGHDPRDYDVPYYERLLRDTFAMRLVRAMSSEDFEHVFASVDQLGLFAPDLRARRPILTVIGDATSLDEAVLDAPGEDDGDDERDG